MNYFWKLLLFPIVTVVQASVVTSIDIKGNNKIHKETIEKYLPIEVGDKVDIDEKNEALKSLYKSGLFKNAVLEDNNGKITISVQEAPIINKISFEGNKKIKDADLDKICLLKENEVLNLTKVKNMQLGLLEAYRNSGMYNVTINPKVTKLSNNRVNLIFEISEQQKARISKIMFIGNKHISSRELRRELYSKQKSWYKFMSQDDLYNPNKISIDKSLIINCYKKRGFAKAKITNVTSELDTEKKNFIITFYIDEGDKFKFGKITKSSKISRLNASDIKTKEYCKTGHDFNSTFLAMDISNIKNAISKKGFLAIDIRPEYTYDLKNKTININFDIIETERKYISKIIINGNTKTRTYVILRELPFEEGDIYSSVLINQAEDNLKQTGFFKNVIIKQIPDPISPDKCIVEVNVEDEQKSGSLQFSFAYSGLEGPTGNIAYSERNFLGYGKFLSFDVSAGRDLYEHNITVDNKGAVDKGSRKKKFNPFKSVNLKVSDPKFLGKNICASIGAFKNTSGQFDSFFINNYGLSIGESHSLSNHITQSIDITGVHKKVAWLDKYLSPMITSQVVEMQNEKLQFNKYKKSNQIALNHDIAYSDNIYKGILNGSYKLGVSTTLGLNNGDSASFIQNILYGVYVKPTFNNNSFIRLKLSFGDIKALNKKDINIMDSFTNSADKIRGFDVGSGCPKFASVRRKFNPIDKNWENTLYIDTAGAKNFFIGSLSYSFPLSFLPEALNVRIAPFIDFGKYWNSVGPKNNMFAKTKHTLAELDQVNTLLKNKTEGIVTMTGNEDEIIEMEYKNKKLKLDKCICNYESIDDINPLVAHKTYEAKKLMKSIGIELSLDTPFGPLAVFFAKPINSDIFDTDKKFGISFSQSF